MSPGARAGIRAAVAGSAVLWALLAGALYAAWPLAGLSVALLGMSAGLLGVAGWLVPRAVREWRAWREARQ